MLCALRENHRPFGGANMPNTGLSGPYPLDWHNVDEHVAAAIGAYALGYVNEQNAFVVRYVGRSDGNLNVTLRRRVGSYKSFKFRHFDTRNEAFERECRMFHDFGGVGSLDNDVHPARPPDTNMNCPNMNCSALN